MNAPLYIPIYAKDWLTDLHVIQMSLAEQGAYMRLLMFCWLEGELPGDMNALGAICGLSAADMQPYWSKLEPRFKKQRDGSYIHERLERERVASLERINKLSESGRVGALARWNRKAERSAPRRREPSERELAAYAILDAGYEKIKQHTGLELTAEAWKRRNKQGALDLVDAGLTPESVKAALTTAYTHPEAKKFYGSLTRLDKLAEALPR